MVLVEGFGACGKTLKDGKKNTKIGFSGPSILLATVESYNHWFISCKKSDAFILNRNQDLLERLKFWEPIK